MNREDIIRMAKECGAYPAANVDGALLFWSESQVERFATIIAAAERENLAAWMIERGYATGHGDTTEDLLKELNWQIDERIAAEREACAKACDVLAVHPEYASDITKVAAQAIRARGEK